MIIINYSLLKKKIMNAPSTFQKRSIITSKKNQLTLGGLKQRDIQGATSS